MKTVIFAALLAGAALSSNLQAQCSSMSPRPFVAWQNEAATVAPAPALSARAELPEHGSNASIVGLWKTTFTSGGQVVDQAFEIFHSDGTEMMVDTAPPASDNVCVGVWAQVSGLGVKLNHPSWTFDDKGTLNGTAAIKMNLTLDPHGASFTGTFTVDVFDLAGNNLMHLTGTVAGKRISAD